MIPVSGAGAAASALVAVLAGGRASRLGGDKATAELAGRALIEHPLAAVREAGLSAVVVARAGTVLPELEAPLLIEPDGPRHPLWGLAAALRSEPAAGRPVLALGCDMPFVPAAMLAALAAEPCGRAATGGPLAICAQGRLQALPARYHAGHAAELERAARAGEAMAATLERLGARALPESWLARFGDPAQLLMSINDPGQLAHARQRLTGRQRG